MNLIFDIGNVICTWNPEALVERIFKSRDHRQEALNSIIHHPDWTSLDKGDIDVDQAVINASSRSFLEEGLIRRVYHETPMSLNPNEPVVKVIHELKHRGYPLYVLSNMQQHSWHWLCSTYDFWSLFDGIVLSYEIHMVKPDREIFDYISNRYNLDPADTLFLDDTFINIETARELGMQVLHVYDIGRAVNELYGKLEIRYKGTD